MRFTQSAPVVAALVTLAGCSPQDVGAASHDLTQRCGVEDLSLRSTELNTSSLNDAVSRAILHGAGECPTSIDAIHEALATDYAQHCSAGKQNSGLAGALISERAGITGRAANYRIVESRQCAVNTVSDVFGLIFEFEANDDGTFPQDLPEGLELIAKDADAGVFNFYAVVDGRWTFFGDSRDMIREGAEDEILCAKCHTSGGLIMRERAMPWPHWTSEFGLFNQPGAQQLHERFPSLPKHGRGTGVEAQISRNNLMWTQRRVDWLREEGTTRQLLEPLFCDTDFQLVANGYHGTFTGGATVDFRCPPGEPTCGFAGFASSLFANDALRGTTLFFPIESDNYFGVVAENNQRIVDVYPDGEQLVHVDGTAVFDNPFGVMYPVRAVIDIIHANMLTQQNLIDAEMWRDVTMVDFTRPVLSEKRCALTAHVPEMGSAFRADDLRQAMIATMETASALEPYEVEFLRSLKTPDERPVHDERLNTFIQACYARSRADNRAFVSDVIRYVSALRDRIRHVPMMRGPHNLPVDDLDVDPTTHFDPATCELTVDERSDGHGG